MTTEKTPSSTSVDSIVRRLRERAAWLESRSFAELHGDIEREAADMITELYSLVERDTTLHDESPAVPISDEEVDSLIVVATEPRIVPFVRGRSIVLTHYEFEGHQEVTAQWREKHPEDGGELWQGKAKTLRDACRNAIDAMFDSF
jgi:hypothetical protein